MPTFSATPVEAIILDSKHKSFVAIDINGAARHHQSLRPLADVNPHVHRGIREQVQPIVGHRAQQFADAARTARDHLLRQHFGPAGPHAVGMRVPENFHRLVDGNLSQLRFVDKCPDANLV